MKIVVSCIPTLQIFLCNNTFLRLKQFGKQYLKHEGKVWKHVDAHFLK